MGKTYRYPCGCSFTVIEERPKFPRLKFNVSKANRDCKSVWSILSKGLTKGVFQLESHLGKKWCKELKPESIEHLTALGAILRPGCLESFDDEGVNTTEHYCRRKNGLEPVEIFHESIRYIVEPTYGLMVYQEQAMQIAQVVAGFNLQEADELRKAIGKKLPEEMAKVKQKFHIGVEKTNILTKEQGETLFGWIEKSQRYSFNKSHSHCYAVNGYWTAYSKAHFPVQFYTSNLRLSHEKPKPMLEIRELVNEAKLLDIEVKIPKLVDLRESFWTDGETIHYGLADVKGVGSKSVYKIKNLDNDCRKIVERGIADMSFYQFLLLLSDYIPSNVIQAWIKVGAFTHCGKSRNRMLAEYDAWALLTDGEKEWIRINAAPAGDLAKALRLAAPTKKNGGATHDHRRSSRVSSAAQLLDNPPSPLEDTPNWIATMEEKHLGIAITCNRVDACDTSEVNTSCKDFLAGKGGGYLIFGVEVEEIRETKTKRGKNPGQLMAHVQVADASAALQMTAFPDVWDEYSGLLVEGNTVIIQAERDKRNDGCIIKKVFQM